MVLSMHMSRNRIPHLLNTTTFAAVAPYEEFDTCSVEGADRKFRDGIIMQHDAACERPGK